MSWIATRLLSLASGLWGKAVLWVAIAGAVALVLLRARQSGREAERVERVERALEVKNAQLDAANRRPRDRNDLAERMRRGDF